MYVYGTLQHLFTFQMNHCRKNIVQKISLLLLLMSFSFVLSAQRGPAYIFRHLDQQDGLKHNKVLDIQQDPRGFMWIATSRGLQRYDGSRFVNFNDMLNDPYQTLNNGAKLFTDKKNNCIWISKATTLEKLELFNYHFTVYESDQAAKNMAASLDTFTDEFNQPRFKGNNIVFSLDSATKKIGSFALNTNADKTHQSNFFIQDDQGQTWLVDFSRGPLLLDNNTKKIYSGNYNPINNPTLAAFKKIFSKNNSGTRNIMQDSHHNFWVSTWGDVFYRYNTSTNTVYSYTVPVAAKTVKNKALPYSVSGMYEDNHGTIWLSTEYAGLLRYDADKDNFETIFIDEKNNNNSPYNYEIFCIFQDKEENIWLGTDKGITIFNPYRQYFQFIHHNENNAASIPDNEINCFIQTRQGKIIAGTWGGGLTIYDSLWNFETNIQFDKLKEYNFIWALVQNDDGNIWAGCQHGYIHIYNTVTKAIQTIHPPELKDYTIRSMAKDDNGNIWMGLQDGRMAEWDKKENKFYSFEDGTQEKKNGQSIMHLFIDRSQHCWAGTESGLKKFNLDKKIFEATYLPDSNKAGSISAKPIEGIEQYDDSTLMVATAYGGLNFLNLRTNTFSSVTQANGLPSNTIHAVKKDAAGYIWFTTDYELYKFKPSDHKFIRYNIEPWMINSTFHHFGFYPLHDGRWVTSSFTEMICFRPDTTLASNNATKVEIAGFKIFDKAFFIDSLLQQQKPVTLDYTQNFITIEFAALHYSSLWQNKYYYKLSGVNNDWVFADTKNFASYTNLEPGQYTFFVKTDNDGDTTSFSIIIKPPFWKTWWFIAIIISASLLVLYGLIKMRINVIRHEAQMKQKIAETEMMALRAQMNPHFIFNCLNSIDNLIQGNEKEKATLYLSKFARLIRSILETSKNNVVPCWKDMETLQLYLELEELRWDKKITCQVNMANEIQQGDYKVPPLVIQPFVENAIYHGLLNKIETGRTLKIDVAIRGNCIHYTIEDNGVGRKKAAEYKQLNKPAHESMGMQISASRINLFNQNNFGAVKITDLFNSEGEPAGTRVEVELINQP